MTGSSSSSKMLQIQGKWYQERNPNKYPKPFRNNPKTILHPYSNENLEDWKDPQWCNKQHAHQTWMMDYGWWTWSWWMKWNEMKWSEVKWSEVKWSEVKWNEMKWSEVKWNEMKWNEMKWSEVKWSEMKWSEVKWNEMKWSEVKWNEMKWNEMNEWWWTSFQMITVVEWIGTLRYQLWCHCKTQLRFDAVDSVDISFNWSLGKKWAMYWQRLDTQTSRRGEDRASGCERFEKNAVFAIAKLLIHSTQ